ncbi:MAG: hypothetical protein ACK46J_07570, partial [Burkholderiales bacterium]
MHQSAPQTSAAASTDRLQSVDAGDRLLAELGARHLAEAGARRYAAGHRQAVEVAVSPAPFRGYLPQSA